MAPSKLIPALTILMCLGVAFASWLIYAGLKDQPAILNTEAPVVASADIPTETFFVFDTPAPLPTSTPYPTSTPISYGDLPITQTAVKVLVIANTAQAGIAQANGTQNALDTAKGNATATQQAVATGTAWALATADAQAKTDQANAERTLARQNAQDSLEIAVAYTWKIGGSILLILAISLTMLWIYYRAQLQAHRKALGAISDDFLENIQAPVVQTSLDTHSGAEHPVAMTAAEMITLKRAVVELKGILSRRRIILGEYFTGTRWRELDDELLNKDANGVAYFDTLPSGAITPTDAGWKWLGLTPPTSPINHEALESLFLRQRTHPGPSQPTSTHLAEQENL